MKESMDSGSGGAAPVNINFIVGPGVVSIILAVAGSGLFAVGYPDNSILLSFGALLYLAAFFALVATVAFHLIVLYRVWQVVERTGVSMTAGKAIAHLFVPFYNLYWAFPLYRGLASGSAAFTVSAPHPIQSIDQRAALAPPLLMITFLLVGWMALPLAVILLVGYAASLIYLTGQCALFLEGALPQMNPPYQRNERVESLIVGAVVATLILCFMFQGMFYIATSLGNG